MQCKKCNSTNLVRNGINRVGTQIWKCKDCGCRGTMSNLDGRPKTNSVCEICGQPAQAKGLCPKHYQQMRKKFRS